MMKNKRSYNQEKDLQLGIQTQQIINQEMVDQSWHYHRAESTDYYVLDALFDELKIKDTDQLVDMGCGTGRVLIYSALKLGLSVIGIEYMLEVYQIASENILAFQRKMNKKYSILLLNQAVEDYSVSTKDTLFYFFNPFSLVVMRSVIYQIMDSLDKVPRKIQLILYYPLDDCVHFIEERTPFVRINQIKLPGITKDKREVIYIYCNEKD